MTPNFFFASDHNETHDGLGAALNQQPLEAPPPALFSNVMAAVNAASQTAPDCAWETMEEALRCLPLEAPPPALFSNVMTAVNQTPQTAPGFEWRLLLAELGRLVTWKDVVLCLLGALAVVLPIYLVQSEEALALLGALLEFAGPLLDWLGRALGTPDVRWPLILSGGLCFGLLLAAVPLLNPPERGRFSL